MYAAYLQGTNKAQPSRLREHHCMHGADTERNAWQETLLYSAECISQNWHATRPCGLRKTQHATQAPASEHTTGVILVGIRHADGVSLRAQPHCGRDDSHEENLPPGIHSCQWGSQRSNMRCMSAESRPAMHVQPWLWMQGWTPAGGLLAWTAQSSVFQDLCVAQWLAHYQVHPTCTAGRPVLCKDHRPLLM